MVSLDFLFHVTLEDVDLDGDLDLACTYLHGFQNHFVGIRLNEVVIFQRGDSSGDGIVELIDASLLLNYILLDGPAPECSDAGDFNDDGRVDLADPIYGLSYLFRDGPEPPGPSDSCGSDPTPDDLGCDIGGVCF